LTIFTYIYLTNYGIVAIAIQRVLKYSNCLLMWGCSCSEIELFSIFSISFQSLFVSEEKSKKQDTFPRTI